MMKLLHQQQHEKSGLLKFIFYTYFLLSTFLLIEEMQMNFLMYPDF